MSNSCNRLPSGTELNSRNSSFNVNYSPDEQESNDESDETDLDQTEV